MKNICFFVISAAKIALYYNNVMIKTKKNEEMVKIDVFTMSLNG